VNVLTTFKHVERAIAIEIIPDTAGDKAYYKVELLHKPSGRKSQASSYQHISILPNEGDLTYILEKSIDGGNNWLPLREFRGSSTLLTEVDDITDMVHIPLKVDIIKIDSTTARIELQNPWYDWHLNHRRSHKYRIKVQDDRGMESIWGSVFDVGMNYRPATVKIRRKEHNGTPATYDGFDALDMWTLTESDVNLTSPLVVRTDDALVAGKNYSYTFYIDDEKGFRSLPFMETHQM
jgi:hypothetical protein